MMLLAGIRRQESSFTLIELILVIFLISIITALSTPLFGNTFSSLKLKNASFNIAKLANFAQEMAILERANYKLNFDIRKGEFWLTRDKLSDEAVAYQELEGSYGKRFSLPGEVEFASFNSQAELFFYPDGRCSRGELKIVNKKGEGRVLYFKGFGSQVEIRDIN